MRKKWLKKRVKENFVEVESEQKWGDFLWAREKFWRGQNGWDTFWISQRAWKTKSRGPKGLPSEFGTRPVGIENINGFERNKNCVACMVWIIKRWLTVWGSCGSSDLPRFAGIRVIFPSRYPWLPPLIFFSRYLVILAIFSRFPDCCWLNISIMSAKICRVRTCHGFHLQRYFLYETWGILTSFALVKK